MSDELDYHSAQHAMQAGVALMMNYEPGEVRPKSLRVGINTAMCDHAALARLLIEKGIIAEDEYMAAIRAEMNREVKRYEERLHQHLGGETEIVLRYRRPAMIEGFLAWLVRGVVPEYLHEPSGSHCGLCGRWVEGDPGDKVYPWNWRWTICAQCCRDRRYE